MYVGLNSWTHELIDTQIIRISSFSITNEIMCMSVWFLDMWTFGHIANACTLLYIHRAYPNVYLNCWTHGLLATQYTLTYKFKECNLCLICISVQSPGHLDFWTHNKKIEMCLRSNHWTHGPLDTQHTLAYKFIECILCFDIYLCSTSWTPGHTTKNSYSCFLQHNWIWAKIVDF